LPDSLGFSGTGSDDHVAFTVGNFAGTGARTHALIFKKSADSVWQTMLDTHGTTGAALLIDGTSEKAMISIDGGSDNYFNSGTFVVADGWCLLAFTKPSGSSAGRFHRYSWVGMTWLHENGTAAQGDLSSLASHHFGAFFDDPGYGTEFFGNILIGGVWDSELSDGAVETLINGTQAWIDLAPDEAWRLDTTGTISSLTGTSTETDRSGLVLDAGQAPSGWADTTGVVSLRIVRASYRWG
jgi:hypothetical protein